MQDNLPCHASPIPEPRPFSPTPPESSVIEGQEQATTDIDRIVGARDEPVDDVEDEWEPEDDVQMSLPGIVQIRGWDVLREQVKSDLKKFSKTLPLSKINQLMIIRNFVTLRLKGFGRIDASIQIARQWHDGDGVWFA
jgi:hypothetical protein